MAARHIPQRVVEANGQIVVFRLTTLRCYLSEMTKLLQIAVKTVSRLPANQQDEIAEAMLSLAGEEAEPEAIDPAHLADVLESLAQARRRQFASDADVEAAFRRFEA